MTNEENIHAGHRERIINKFIENPEALDDHELLEVLLFPLIPRVNTNGIAHRILREFGTLERVFGAKSEELMLVDGVGKKTAGQIALYGKIFREIYRRNKFGESPKWATLANAKEILFDYFSDVNEEIFLLVLLDKNKKEIMRVPFADHKRTTVSVDVSQVAKIISKNNTSSIIVAHNHLSGSESPSTYDDDATLQLIAICNIQGITFNDHIIIAKNKAYSYYADGRINYLKEINKDKMFVRTNGNME